MNIDKIKNVIIKYKKREENGTYSYSIISLCETCNISRRKLYNIIKSNNVDRRIGKNKKEIK